MKNLHKMEKLIGPVARDIPKEKLKILLLYLIGFLIVLSILQEYEDYLDPDLSKPDPTTLTTIASSIPPLNAPTNDSGAAPRKSTNPEKLYTNENDLFDANSNTALTNSTTTNPPPPTTTTNNDDDKTTSGVKNPRELFPGRPGPAQDGNNNDGFQGKFCLSRMGYYICINL